MNGDNHIPFNKPFIVGNELHYIKKAIGHYGHLAGDGMYGQMCQKWLEETLGCKKVLITHSCTAALEMSALLCGIQSADEIIMPSYTFVSSANAFVLRGGVPVFVDIRPDTLNIDERLIEKAITERTKAIVAVHYAGFPCKMNKIMKIAEKHNLIVIEDAAQALYSKYQDRNLGTIGHIGALSFHETKNIISGEGGALLINDSRFFDRAEVIWEKGTNRKQFFRGEVDKYTWVDVGSSYLPSELVSAFLYAQLEQSEKIMERRHYLCGLYSTLLKPLASSGYFQLPIQHNDEQANGHMFFIITSSLEERSRLINYLRTNNISAVFHYVPLHDSPSGKRFGRTNGALVVTERLSDQVLRLPLYFEMQEHQVKRVVKHVKEFYLGSV